MRILPILPPIYGSSQTDNRIDANNERERRRDKKKAFKDKLYLASRVTSPRISSNQYFNILAIYELRDCKPQTILLSPVERHMFTVYFILLYVTSCLVSFDLRPFIPPSEFLPTFLVCTPYVKLYNFSFKLN